MAKLPAFKADLQTAKHPRSLIVQTYGAKVAPTDWDTWVEQNVLAKHAGSYDVRLRMAEPDKQDCFGEKYRIDDGKKRSRALTLQEALWAFVEREDHDDRIIVVGSNRPIVIWKVPDGLRLPVPCVFWPGASVVEAIAVQNSPVINRKSREVVLIRVRCRRFTKERIEAAARLDLKMIEGIDAPERHFGRKGNLSAFCLSAILRQCEEVEAAARSSFSGTPAKG